MTPPSFGDSATCSSLTQTTFWPFTHTHTIPARARPRGATWRGRRLRGGAVRNSLRASPSRPPAQPPTAALMASKLARRDASRSLYIDGAWERPAVDIGILHVMDAATDECVARMPAAGPDDVARAVGAARRAFERSGWATCSGAERAKVLRKIAALVADAKGDLARMEAHMGKPLPEAEWDMDDVSGCFEYFAGEAERLDTRQGRPVALPDDDYRAELRYEPTGVVGAITPWNYPMLMAAWKVAPALAAGCSVVLKPSELSPSTCLELGPIARAAGLPDGLLNVLAGGKEAGAALASHPDVDKVAFTGSAPAGASVGAAAAARAAGCTLELGGKSALIVFDDADIERAVEWAMFGAFWTNGQICSATSRLLVHQPIAKKLLARLVECARAIPLVAPLDPDHASTTGTLGPLVSSAARDKVERLVREALEQGATLLTGGRRPPGRPRGYWYEPTVLQVSPSSCDIWRTEVGTHRVSRARALGVCGGDGLTSSAGACAGIRPSARGRHFLRRIACDRARQRHGLRPRRRRHLQR